MFLKHEAEHLQKQLMWGRCSVKMSVSQVEMTKCVMKKDPRPEHHWLTSTMESLKYFLSAVYVYVMKEP